MKCGKCGQNEANYYYRETVNGVTREVRLCTECAKEEGLEDRFARHFDFGRSFGFADSFFEDFFRLPFTPAMALSRRTEQKEQTQEKQESESCDPALKQRRERNVLEQKLKEAVDREDYETAITLRDQLKKMK